MAPQGSAPARAATIVTPLGPDALWVSALRGREAVSELFEFAVDVLAERATAVAFDQLLGRPAAVKLDRPGQAPRVFHGLVRSVAALGEERGADDVRLSRYRLVLVPQLWTLTRRRRSRIFQQMTVPDILKAALQGVDATVSLQGRYEPRNYCTQYRETDFAFVSRLMEEEGIYYFFTHAEGGHKLVLADTPSGHPAASPAKAAYAAWAEGERPPEDRVVSWEKEQTLGAGKVLLWDHHFELPGQHLEASAAAHGSVAVGGVTHKLRTGGNDAFELYDYPGGYAQRFDGVAPGGGDRAADVQKVFQDNVRTANLRIGAEEAAAIRTRGSGTCRQFSAGLKFSLDRPGSDDSGEYVLLSVEHDLRLADALMSGDGGDFSYANRFACVPTALPFRPERRTPRPTVAGCQTAVVVGPKGEEIFTDKYGRVKLQFHWDREGKLDANSSCWVRVATVWAGKQWGAIHIPRVGQEVIVDFLEGDPDRPIVVGSVYNAEQMPPYKLPDNRTQSGIKTRSSLKGTDEHFNELRFEDKKDAEQIYLHAERNLDVVVENHRTTKIGGNCTTDLLAKPTDPKDPAEGHQTLTIHKGNQTSTLKEGNQTVTLQQGDQKVELQQGNRSLTVNGDDATKVTTGNRTVTVADGNHTITVEKGNQKVQIKMGNDEVVVDMGNYKLTTKMGNIDVKATMGKITLEAMQGIELKCGANSLKVDQTGVTVKGIMVKVEGTAMAQVKSPMTQVNGDAMLMAKGGITMIN